MAPSRRDELPDYYKVLQVDPAAEPEVIEGAYKRLANKYHPDKNPSPKATRKMQEINVAYDVLSDPGKRADYDRGRRVEKPNEPDSAVPPEPVVRPPELNFGSLEHGEVRTGQVVVDNRGGPPREANLSVSRDDGSLRISSIKEQSDDRPFPLVVQLTIDTRRLTPGRAYVNSLEVNLDGIIRKVRVGATLEQEREPPPPPAPPPPSPRPPFPKPPDSLPGPVIAGPDIDKERRVPFGLLAIVGVVVFVLAVGYLGVTKVERTSGPVSSPIQVLSQGVLQMNSGVEGSPPPERHHGAFLYLDLTAHVGKTLRVESNSNGHRLVVQLWEGRIESNEHAWWMNHAAVLGGDWRWNPALDWRVVPGVYTLFFYHQPIGDGCYTNSFPVNYRATVDSDPVLRNPGIPANPNESYVRIFAAESLGPSGEGVPTEVFYHAPGTTQTIHIAVIRKGVPIHGKPIQMELFREGASLIKSESVIDVDNGGTSFPVVSDFAAGSYLARVYIGGQLYKEVNFSVNLLPTPSPVEQTQVTIPTGTSPQGKPEPQEPVSRPPPSPSNYSGSTSGIIQWQGDVSSGAEVVIQDGRSILGAVEGNLPGVGCQLEVVSSTKPVAIAEPPSPTNNWSRVVVRVTGKGRQAFSLKWTVIPTKE